MPALIQNHTANLSKNLEFYSSKYENFIVIGDFNAAMANSYLQEFSASYNLKNLIKQPNCFKNLENPNVSTIYRQTTQKVFIRQVLYDKVCLISMN